MEARDTPQGQVALKFAKALGAGKYDAAHTMLSPVLRQSISAAELAQKYKAMVAEGGPADYIDVIDAANDLPGKQTGDVGRAYASISGPLAAGGSWKEGVAVVVTQLGEEQLIREIKWGRP
jgi:hypothetical protein